MQGESNSLIEQTSPRATENVTDFANDRPRLLMVA